MSKMIIVEGNSNDKDNTRVFMVKGEKGDTGDVSIEELNTEIANRISADENLRSQINSLASGSPLVASSTAEMTDTNKVYVNTTDGNWYYYNGSSWSVGGIYQASEDSEKLSLLKANFDNNIKYSNEIIGSKKILKHTIQFEQGRWIIDASNTVIKETGASSSTTSVRIRSKNVLSFEHNVKINIISGYSCEINLINDNMELQRDTGWLNNFTVLAGQKFVLLIRENNDAVINATDIDTILSVTEMNQININENNLIRFTTGSYNWTSFNNPILFSQEAVAVPIRIASENIIDKPYKLKVNEGYNVSIVNRLYNGNFASVLDNLTNTEINYKGKNSTINIRKSDNANINPEDYENAISIKYYNGFTFENGSSGVDTNNKYEQNNSSIALPIRLRTNPTYIDKPFRIIAKEGYTVSISKYDKNNIKIKDIISNGTTWLNTYTCEKGYWNIVIKSNSGSNIYTKYIDYYIEIDYDVYTYNERPNHLENMNVLFIGDSITENNYSAECNWTNLLNAQFNFKNTNNIAVGGTGIVRGGSNAWYNKIESLDNTQYDLILIMGNMNDYSGNVFTEENLGQFGDNSLSTEYGALKLFIEKVMNKYPLAKIGWITSTPRQYYAGDDDNLNPVTSDGYLWGNNSVFENANKAIIETCKNYSIPVLDLFHNSNFRVWNNNYRNKYFYNDGNSVHPNDLGNQVIYNLISNFVIKNF